MVGRVGNDEFGPQLLEALHLSGVNTSNVGTSDISSGIAIILIDDSSQNQITQILGANETCGNDEKQKISSLLECSSTLLLQLEVSIDLSLEVAQEAYQNDVTNRETAEKAAYNLLGKGISNAIIKLGEHGAFYANTSESGYIPPFRVKAVDSVGAGDAFNGALAVSLSENNSLGEATRFASAAGALAVTKIGAQDAMPTRSEIENLL